MPRRTIKKCGKLRGGRTHGGGDSKNRRGKGCKGGWGRAGMKKHRRSYILKYEPDFFGGSAVANPNRKIVKTTNLFDVQNLFDNNKLGKEALFEFNGKVLGRGKLIAPVKVRALFVSDKAKQAIEKAGGSVEILDKPIIKAKKSNKTVKKARKIIKVKKKTTKRRAVKISNKKAKAKVNTKKVKEKKKVTTKKK